MYLRVTAAHRSKFPNPLSFSAGEQLRLGRSDEEYPGWIWTTNAAGLAGWAPAALIDAGEGAQGVAREDYTARELNTTVGELVRPGRELDGWLWVEESDGESGWVPAATLSRPGFDTASLVEADFHLQEFAFKSGETMESLRLHYRTLGQPQRDGSGRVSNAVWIGHGTTGSGAAFLRKQFADVLFAPGGLLDVAEHYLILPDGIGHGRSSRPSDGLRARFPRYGYEDMIHAQHRLLTAGLGVDHLRLAMGTSMGGMHCWLWGYLYPDFVDALLPLASLPVQIAGRNRMLRRLILDAIRLDPAWKAGEYEAQPAGLRAAIYVLIFMTSVPLHWQQLAPDQASADAFAQQLVERLLARHDANDFLYQFDASWDFDPEPYLKNIQAPLLAINSADDQVNPPELGIMERQIRRVRRGRYVLLPVSEQTRGHGTHSWPALWQEHLAALLAES